MGAVRDGLARFFGKRGDAVVDANMAVVRAANNGVIEVTAAITGGGTTKHLQEVTR